MKNINEEDVLWFKAVSRLLPARAEWNTKISVGIIRVPSEIRNLCSEGCFDEVVLPTNMSLKFSFAKQLMASTRYAPYLLTVASEAILKQQNVLLVNMTEGYCLNFISVLYTNIHVQIYLYSFGIVGRNNIFYCAYFDNCVLETDKKQ